MNLSWLQRPQATPPTEDVATERLEANDKTKKFPNLGTAQFYDVIVADRIISDAAWSFPDSEVEQLRTAYRFDWDAMDAWFEEDDEVLVHARDPYTRIAVLNSNRHVEIAINGFLVADSHSPRMLHETGMPTRYYLPKTDIRMDLIRHSDTLTHCPYKGTANALSMEVDGQVVKDIARSYSQPLAESQKVAGLVSFLNEKVDVYIDGVLQGAAKAAF